MLAWDASGFLTPHLPLFLLLLLLSLRCSLLPEPAAGKQSGDGDSQHSGEKHHLVKVRLPFHSTGPAPARLQCHDEQQRLGWVLHKHPHLRT